MGWACLNNCSGTAMVKQSGELVILDTTDQGLHRQVKVARLIRPAVGAATMELVDPHILWMSGSASS